MAPFSTSVQDATRKMAALTAKLDDLEDHSRCNNLRFVGLLEKSEGTQPKWSGLLANGNSGG